MKREHPIRTMLGLKQEDIALLLGVSRPHWGMVETGKRDLPLHANQLLGQIVLKLNKSETVSKLQQTAQHLATKQKFEKLQHENTFQILHLEREIAASIKKQGREMRLLQLSDLLNGFENKKPFQAGMVSVISAKASGADDAVVAAVLAEQEHRMELLQFEKTLLESKLKKLESEIEESKTIDPSLK